MDLQTVGAHLARGAFVLAGLWYTGIGVRRLLLRNPELDWVAVDGVVRASEVDGRSASQDDVQAARLAYEYEFGGVRYVHDRIAPLQPWSSFRRTAESFVRRYPPGRKVKVYVNPTSPGNAMLEPRKQTVPAVVYLLLGAVCLFVPLLDHWLRSA